MRIKTEKKSLFQLGPLHTMGDFSGRAKYIKNTIMMRGFLSGNRLYEEDYVLLQSITNWSKSKIDEYFSCFLSCCENGKLPKKVIFEVLNNILPMSSAKGRVHLDFLCN